MFQLDVRAMYIARAGNIKLRERKLIDEPEDLVEVIARQHGLMPAEQRLVSQLRNTFSRVCAALGTLALRLGQTIARRSRRG